MLIASADYTCNHVGYPLLRPPLKIVLCTHHNCHNLSLYRSKNHLRLYLGLALGVQTPSGKVFAALGCR